MMPGRPQKEAWLVRSWKDKLIEATWYLFQIRPGICKHRGRDLILSDHLIAEVVKGFDGYTWTLVFQCNEEGCILNWIPLVKFIGADYRSAIVDKLGFTFAVDRYRTNERSGYIHDLLDEDRRTRQY